MIILVAVTLNIALGENGLIAKAKETRTKQEEQTIYEHIQGMMELNDNGEIDVDKTVDNVKAKYPGTELSGTTLIVPGKYGTYNYEIKTTGIEIAEKIVPKDFDLEKYILGEDKQGRSLWEIVNEETGQFIDDPETTDVDESTISVISEIAGGAKITKDVDGKTTEVYTIDNVYVLYNNEIYKFTLKYDAMLDDNTKTMETYRTVAYSGAERIIRIGTLEEKEVVELGGKNWIILNRDGDNVELISEETLNANGVQLGYSEKENDTRTDAEKLSEAQDSYNNAITTLNDASVDAAKDILMQIDGIEYSVSDKKLKYTGTIGGEAYEEEIKVRSVGSNPTNPASETATNFKISDIPFKDGDNTITLTGFDDKGKDTDYNYAYDYDRIIRLGITCGYDRYWLASRLITVDYSRIVARIRYIDEDGYCDSSWLWGLGTEGTEATSNTRGVRPVISLSSKLLEQLKNS